METIHQRLVSRAAKGRKLDVGECSPRRLQNSLPSAFSRLFRVEVQTRKQTVLRVLSCYYSCANCDLLKWSIMGHKRQVLEIQDYYCVNRLKVSPSRDTASWDQWSWFFIRSSLFISTVWSIRGWAGKPWRSPSMVWSTKWTFPTLPTLFKSCCRRILWGEGKDYRSCALLTYGLLCS